MGRIVGLFSDFGSSDIYVGQVKARMLAECAGLTLIDVCHDVPPFNLSGSASLLAALFPFIACDVVFAVVDPGVGTARTPIAARVDSRWIVGPDNGLLGEVIQRAQTREVYEITWRPSDCSQSFHGRDLFGPVCAWLACGRDVGALLAPRVEWVNAQKSGQTIIYIDHYGNAITDIPAGAVAHHEALRVSGTLVKYARVFGEAPEGTPFWYDNSVGLVELALNRGSAAEHLGLRVGQAVELLGRSS